MGRTHTNGLCEMDQMIDYEITVSPSHGIACFRVETMKLKVTRPNNTQCIGATALGRTVYYRPNGTYVGADAFQYIVLDDRHVATAIADISVIVDPPLAPPVKSTDRPTESIQTPGPMPRCPDTLM
jgi:hypothetical protein